MNRTNKVYTTAELAAELKISRRAVLRAIRAGELKAAKFSSILFRIESADVDAWIASLKK